MSNLNIHRAGLVVAASIPLFILPARISEGQLSDPINLVGSETVIFLMSLTCWYCINFIQAQVGGWKGLCLSVLCCCVLSNVFYFTFNPIFKDFPFRTATNPIGIRILMLSSRGVLMSIILVPAAYFLKRDNEARRQRKENERLVMERIKIENQVLEAAVAERTDALHQALGSLQRSQEELEHQLYIQSRLVASITHDVRGPFNYLVVVSDKIRQLSQQARFDEIGPHSEQLHKQLETMFGFVKNLLDFARLPVQQKLGQFEKVNLGELISQKAKLFQGLIQTNNNKLSLETDPAINVLSNPNLLGIVLHNLIDNANKHTRSGEIRLTTKIVDAHVRVVIENTGNAASGAVIEWFNADVNSIGIERLEDSGISPGIGLILVKEIAKILNLKVEMETYGQGTRLSILF
ncbi:Signal transduction histidine kinase [Dyadobacter soli]|uniref:histidine kinase n=1 Tax=Dyadobacter soli TaxID=659014 RepID=A0A1G7NBP7_9BACT|nr:HAMP domain-containing sensor histidine kinase [Dyadobacter soli]SDF71351.1 Signal transduction histidine kinase [Dyadobacter soli]